MKASGQKLYLLYSSLRIREGVSKTKNLLGFLQFLLYDRHSGGICERQVALGLVFL